MDIRELIDKNVWENFVAAQNERTFLNSWNWGEFQAALGQKIWRLGIFDGENLIAVVLAIKIQARRGKFLFCPHGPCITKSRIWNLEYRILKELVDYLKNLAEQERCSFLRWNPLFENAEENRLLFKTLGFRNAPIHIHPEITWVLNITKSEDDMLKGMRKTTRYLIKKAQETGINVEVIRNPDEEKLKVFHEMYKDLARRQHFTPFSFEYIKKQFESFSTNTSLSHDREIMTYKDRDDRDGSALFLGKHNGKVLAGAIVVYWGGIGFYHHGASYPVNSNKVPVAYLVQWEAIQEAKRRGCSQYNFWGVAPTDDPKHPWAGLTLFKQGFGGEKREYVKTQDLPLNWKYWVNFAVEKLRARRRGY